MRRGLNKGTYGYIVKYKKRFGLISLFWILWIAVLFTVGCLIYQTKMNIWTLFAVLFVLPAARSWVAFIVMLPYHSGDEKDYKHIQRLMEGKSARVYADLVITKYEGAMYLPIVVNFDDNFYAYAPGQKRPLSEIRSYLNQILKSAGAGTKAMVFEDYHKFEAAVIRMSEGADLCGRHMDEMENQLLSVAL